MSPPNAEEIAYAESGHLSFLEAKGERAAVVDLRFVSLARPTQCSMDRPTDRLFAALYALVHVVALTDRRRHIGALSMPRACVM